jgi:Helix-turn-helix domain
LKFGIESAGSFFWCGYRTVKVAQGNQMNARRNLGREIRRQRMALRVSQTLAAQWLGRSQKWLSLIESGLLRVNEEKAKRILAAISRIGHANDSVALDFSDLRFSARRRRSKPTRNHQRCGHQGFKKEATEAKIGGSTNSETIQKIDEIAERLRSRC